MNTELFISKRLFFDKSNEKLLSQRIIRIALAGIALGLVVMIISVSVVTGFKKEIRNKIIGFGSNIQIVNFDSNSSFETRPISENQPFLPLLNDVKGINHIQTYATKPGIIKTEEYIQGIVFKGVSTNYDWSFFGKNLVEGRLPQLNDSTRVNEVLVSSELARLLQLKLDEKSIFYFLNENDMNPRLLQLEICGIYNTGFGEFDQRFVLGDIKQIQRLNKWSSQQISGFEIAINDFYETDRIEQEIRNIVIQFRDEHSDALRTQSIVRTHPQIFDWLSVLDMNVWIILGLMVMVAGLNMVSGLLVLILERSNMIGVLKAMGSPNWSIRKVFIYLSVFLTSRGMLWGNIIGITVIVVQNIFHIVKLDPSSYFMAYVPMNFSLSHLLLLNLGTIAAIALILIVPSYFISRISPDKTIRFD